MDNYSADFAAALIPFSSELGKDVVPRLTLPMMFNPEVLGLIAPSKSFFPWRLL